MSAILAPSFDPEDPALRRVEGGFPVFSAVLEALPRGTIVLRAKAHGDHCSWFRIGCLEATDSDGNTVHFFVKYGKGEVGRQLLGSEHQTHSLLHQLIPDNLPKPISWGNLGLSSPHDGTFFLTDFVQFVDQALPEPDAVGSLVAKLHTSSKGGSQHFGTSQPRFDGLLCYVNGTESHWPVLFAKILYQAYHYNMLSTGRWDELHHSISRVIKFVVPRLLGALELNGRKIEPCLIHGDLWNGNFGTSVSTGKLYIFDSSSYWAHNEMEFAYWRTQHHGMHKKDYCGAYFKHCPPSEPMDEFEDRVLLYTLKPCLIYSSMRPGHITRQRALDNMKYLLEKYCPESSTVDKSVDAVFREIANGDHLWVKEYPGEVANFINARKEQH